MSCKKYIKNWIELSREESSTHILEINVDDGCGWIVPKDDKYGYGYYLSTHTFYGGFNDGSTKILQSCGFNVELANWDEM